MYLSTASTTFTSTASEVLFTFTTSCTPPGQVLFQSLADGDHTLTVSKAGYTTHIETVTVDAGTQWKEVQVVLAP